MNTLASDAIPDWEDDEGDMTESKPLENASTRGRGKGEWRVVAKTAGLTPARILADRLKSEGIPARAWQEGAGQAIGLTIGLLGTGYVMVPTTFVQQAEALLAEPSGVDWWDEEE